ncbi:MAG: hypothetical protein ACI9U2_003830 [Bradymonadia bacterium]|jgi:hypothetical protein
MFGLHRLVPKPMLMAEILGIFAEAQRKYPQVRLHFLVMLSNHYICSAAHM